MGNHESTPAHNHHTAYTAVEYSSTAEGVRFRGQRGSGDDSGPPSHPHTQGPHTHGPTSPTHRRPLQRAQAIHDPNSSSNEDEAATIKDEYRDTLSPLTLDIAAATIGHHGDSDSESIEADRCSLNPNFSPVSLTERNIRFVTDSIDISSDNDDDVVNISNDAIDDIGSDVVVDGDISDVVNHHSGCGDTCSGDGEYTCTYGDNVDIDDGDDIGDDMDDGDVSSLHKSYSAPSSTTHTYRSTRLRRSESHESNDSLSSTTSSHGRGYHTSTLGSGGPSSLRSSPHKSATAFYKEWSQSKSRAAHDNLRSNRSGFGGGGGSSSLSSLPTLRTTRPMFSRHHTTATASSSPYINDLGAAAAHASLKDLRLRRMSSEYSDTFSGITTPDSELFDPGDVGLSTAAVITKIETEMGDLQKELEDMELGMMRLTSRDDMPVKDMGFHSDAAKGREFHRALCVLQRHKNKSSPHVQRSLSVSDADSEELMPSPTADSPTSPSSPLADKTIRHAASKLNARRSIHSDSDYVWEYCPDQATAEQSSPMGSNHASESASGPSGVLDVYSYESSDEIFTSHRSTDQSPPPDSASGGGAAHFRLSPRRSNSPPLSVIKSFLASPQSSSHHSAASHINQSEHSDDLGDNQSVHSDQSHDPQLRRSHDSGVGVSPVDEAMNIHDSADGMNIHERDNASQSAFRDRLKESLESQQSSIPFFSSPHDKGEPCVSQRSDLLQYAQSTWSDKTPLATRMLQGYNSVYNDHNLHEIVVMRADNYCGIRSICYHLLVSHHQHFTRTLGALHDITQRIRSSGLFMPGCTHGTDQWSFAGRLSLGGRSVYDRVILCLTALFDLVAILEDQDFASRERLVTEHLNQSEERDAEIMEAIKVVMMLECVSLHSRYLSGMDDDNLPLFSHLMFARETSRDPRDFLRNHLNHIGDAQPLRQIELYLLAHTLAVNVTVFCVDKDITTDDFITHYLSDAKRHGDRHVPSVHVAAESDTQYHSIS